MSHPVRSFDATRRRILKLFGLGAAGSALGVVASDKVFAKQFAGVATEVTKPTMIYDPEQQVMVDPLTRRPVYEDPKELRLALPTVTSGCGNCPKKDD